MEYRSLGRTGVKVSEICLGTMMFNFKTNEEDSISMMEYALDNGVNFIDTANVYAGTKSEVAVGKALVKSGKRADTILATKVFFPTSQERNQRGPNRRNIIQACEDSLRRLQTDWIDLYQMHRSDANVPIDETLRALDDLIRDGKVRYIGCSMYAAWQIVESLWVAKELGLNRFVSEQPAYHLLDRTIEREVIPACQSFGLAVLPWGPLCGGLLSDKYKRGQMDNVEGRWQGGADNHNRRATDKAFDVLEGLGVMARDKGCSVSQLALAWCAAQPGVTSPIIGPRTQEQLVDNLGATEVELTEEDLAKIDELAPPKSVSLRYYDAANKLDLRPHYYRW